MTEQRTLHAITPDMRAHAKNTPSSWFYVIDPFFNPNGEVPAFGIVGWYWIDGNGEFEESFNENPKYRPSPIALKFPTPHSDAEALVQLTAAGYAAESQLVECLIENGALAVSNDTGVAVFRANDKGFYVVIYTSEHLIPDSVTSWLPVNGQSLRTLSNDVEIKINAECAPSIRIPVGGLRALPDEPATESTEEAGRKIVVDGEVHELDSDGEGLSDEDHTLRIIPFGRGGDFGEGLGESVRSMSLAEIHAQYGQDGLKLSSETRVTGPPRPYTEKLAFGISSVMSEWGARERGQFWDPANSRVYGVDVRDSPREYNAIAYCVGTAARESMDSAAIFDLTLSIAGQWDISAETRFTAASVTLLMQRVLYGGSLTGALSSLLAELRRRSEPEAVYLNRLLSQTESDYAPGFHEEIVHSSDVEALVGDGSSVAALFNAAVAITRGTSSFDSSIERAINTSVDSAFLGFLVTTISTTVRCRLVPRSRSHEHDPEREWRIALVGDYGHAFDHTEDIGYGKVDDSIVHRYPPPVPLEPAVLLNPHERFMGSMVAGALGDALGYAIEFQGMEMIRRHHGDEGLTQPMLHNGIAQVSDDTQMMLFTLEGLIRAHVARRTRPMDSDPVPEVQHAYQRWFHTQNQPWERASGPFGRHAPQADGWLITNRELFSPRAPGSTCMAALANFAQTHRYATPNAKINDSKGCGGVMRAAPVAVWSVEPEEVFHAAVGTAALTHSHPSGFLPAGVLAVLVHQLIRDVPLGASVRLSMELLTRWPGHEEQLRALEAAVELAESGPVAPERLREALGAGWVGEEALAIGLYAALVTGNVRDALLLSVNHSGDSDSTGIVCGNIAGAMYGLRDIPPEWVEKLELYEVIYALADDALTEFSPDPPTDPRWTQRYPDW